MPTYKAPLRDIKFLMNELLGAPEQLGQMPYYAQNETADQDLLEQVLDEAARFVETELVPLNVVGDREGCVRHDDGEVTTPTGFKAAYRKYRDAGWPALDADPAFGGQGMPHLISNVLVEMMNSERIALRDSSAMRRMMSAGTAAGALMPYHCAVSNPGKPCSESAGTSGITCERLSPVMATARNLPPRTCCESTATEAIVMSICPPNASTVIGPPPL